MIKEKEEIDHAIWPLSSRDANDKTAIAVMLCILLFRFLNRGQPLIAALSAVFSLRQDLTTTLSFGKSRVLGNSIGGATAIIYFFMKQYFHNDF